VRSARSPSVGMFTYSTLPRGSVVHAAALAEALCELGIETRLYALAKGGSGFFRPLRCPLTLIPAQAAAGSGETLIRQRISEVSEFIATNHVHHTVLHAQDCLTASGLLATQLRAPIARTVHHVEAFSNPFLAFCQERSILQSHRLCVVSHATQREVRENFGRSATWVGNGVRDRMTALDPGAVARLRERLLGANAGPLLLSFGGVEWRKNSLATLRAFSQIKRRFPQAVWAIAGGASVLDHGGYRAEFDAQLRASGHGECVVELGVVSEEDAVACLASADALLCASLQEGFGLSALEAASVGIPLVVSHGAPFDEYLDAGCAWFTDPGDPGAIAAAVERALLDPLSKQLAARRVACAHTWRRVAERCAVVYEQMAGTRPALEPAHA
jgi:glycosyltransferase-like protein